MSKGVHLSLKNIKEDILNMSMFNTDSEKEALMNYLSLEITSTNVILLSIPKDIASGVFETRFDNDIICYELTISHYGTFIWPTGTDSCGPIFYNNVKCVGVPIKVPDDLVGIVGNAIRVMSISGLNTKLLTMKWLAIAPNHIDLSPNGVYEFLSYIKTYLHLWVSHLYTKFFINNNDYINDDTLYKFASEHPAYSYTEIINTIADWIQNCMRMSNENNNYNTINLNNMLLYKIPISKTCSLLFPITNYGIPIIQTSTSLESDLVNLFKDQITNIWKNNNSDIKNNTVIDGPKLNSTLRDIGFYLIDFIVQNH